MKKMKQVLTWSHHESLNLLLQQDKLDQKATDLAPNCWGNSTREQEDFHRESLTCIKCQQLTRTTIRRDVIWWDLRVAGWYLIEHLNHVDIPYLRTYVLYKYIRGCQDRMNIHEHHGSTIKRLQCFVYLNCCGISAIHSITNHEFGSLGMKMVPEIHGQMWNIGKRYIPKKTKTCQCITGHECRNQWVRFIKFSFLQRQSATTTYQSRKVPQKCRESLLPKKWK